jgi:glycosyltransferase involved in cell wall biosynthesis
MLREAIESVRAQTVKDVEIIVIDSHSTDETAEVLRRAGGGILHLQQERLGVAAARNLGIQHASAAYIAFLDSDDRWLPGKLERQLAYLREHPEVGLVYARMWSYHVDRPAERRLDPYVIARTFEELLNGPNAVTTSTVLLRRECLDAAGVFNPALRAAEDHELWLRIARKFSIAFLDDVMGEYRRHGESINTNPSLLYDGYRRYFEIILREYRGDLHAPRAAERQLAKFEYLCGTSALKRGRARAAARLISRALRRDVALGTQFIGADASWAARVWLPLKPYAALAVSGLKSLGTSE